MKQFEYYSFCGYPGDEVDQTLDDLGIEGWEAFAIIPQGEQILVYLKRELQK